MGGLIRRMKMCSVLDRVTSVDGHASHLPVACRSAFRSPPKVVDDAVCTSAGRKAPVENPAINHRWGPGKQTSFPNATQNSHQHSS